MFRRIPPDCAYIDFEQADPQGAGEWWSVDVVFRRPDDTEIDRVRIPEQIGVPLSISRLYAARRALHLVP
jgi:hypothetical protein